MNNIKKELQKNASVALLIIGTINIMAGLYSFDGGLLDALNISIGIVLLSLFARGA